MTTRKKKGETHEGGSEEGGHWWPGGPSCGEKPAGSLTSQCSTPLPSPPYLQVLLHGNQSLAVLLHQIPHLVHWLQLLRGSDLCTLGDTPIK